MALPSITDSTEPVSLSKAVFRGLLHDSLGYSGVAVADVGSRSALGRPPLHRCRCTARRRRHCMICYRLDGQPGALEALYRGTTQSGAVGRYELCTSGQHNRETERGIWRGDLRKWGAKHAKTTSGTHCSSRIKVHARRLSFSLGDDISQLLCGRLHSLLYAGRAVDLFEYAALAIGAA